MKAKHILLFLLTACLLFCTACSSEEETDVPDGCLLAENDATDFSFCYPDTWELDRNDGKIVVKYNVGNNGTLAYANVAAEAYTLANTDTLAGDYWESYKADLTELYGEKLSITSEKQETALDGLAAYRCRYDITLSDVTYTFEQVFCIRYGTVYLLTFTTPADAYDSAAEGFETVLANFRFED